MLIITESTDTKNYCAITDATGTTILDTFHQINYIGGKMKFGFHNTKIRNNTFLVSEGAFEEAQDHGVVNKVILELALYNEK